MCKQKKCLVCGKPGGGCTTVAQAANCNSRGRLLSILIIAALMFLSSCGKPAEQMQPEKFSKLTEADALFILKTGAAQGREYIVTKHGDGDNARYDVVQVNFKPRK